MLKIKWKHLTLQTKNSTISIVVSKTAANKIPGEPLESKSATYSHLEASEAQW